MIRRLTIEDLKLVEVLLNNQNKSSSNQENIESFLNNKSNEPAITLYESLQGKAYNEDDIIYTFKSEQFEVYEWKNMKKLISS